MTPARVWLSTNGSIIWCSSAIRLIHVSALMDIDQRHASDREHERSRTVRASSIDAVSVGRRRGGASEGYSRRSRSRAESRSEKLPRLTAKSPGRRPNGTPSITSRPSAAIAEADQDERLAHTLCHSITRVTARESARSDQVDARRRSTRSRTPPSRAHRIRASRCARSTARTPCAACPASALAGIGRAHQRPPLLDRVRRLEHQHDRRPRRHELGQAARRTAARDARRRSLRPALRQVHAPHGTNLESLVLDALNDPAGEPPFDGVRLDDGQRPFGHPAIIAGATSATCRSRSQRSTDDNVTSTAARRSGHPQRRDRRRPSRRRATGQPARRRHRRERHAERSGRDRGGCNRGERGRVAGLKNLRSATWRSTIYRTISTNRGLARRLL